MGAGDLNMKKSWHPALLVNQERVWAAERKDIDEKKKLMQLKKERDEERQLAELQRMQEAATGKKRVERLDWMYSAPSNEGGMGGRFNERELEDYLLGKKRVDEMLAQSDKNVGNAHKDFIAVQNANTARDTAAKVREDPILAMKKAEQAQLAALMNRPDIRRQMKAAKEAREGKGSKEERRERRRAEKEERRRERHERHRDRSPRSDDDDYRRRRDDRDDRERRHRDRSTSPRRDRDSRRDRDERRDRDDRRDRDRDYRRRNDDRDRRDDRDDRDRGRDRRDDRDDRRDRHDRPRSRSPKREPESSRNHYDRPRSRSPKREPESSRNHYDRPLSRSPKREPVSERNGHSAPRYDDRRGFRNDRPRRPSPERKPEVKSGNSLDDMRAARLAAMTASADQLQAERTKKLAAREAEERKVFEAEEKARSRYHKDEAAGLFMKQQEQMSGGVSLGEALGRRGGKGLLRDI